MANTTIDQLASLAAADVANTDLLLIYDGSAVIEKQLSISDLRTAVYASGPVVGSNSFTVSGTGNSDVFIVTSTDSTAASAPDVILYRNSESPAASDLLGEITFRGKNSANAVNKYAAISSIIVSPTAGAESGAIIISTMTAGTIAERMRIRDDGGIGIGSAGIVTSTLRINKNITGGVSQTVIRNDGDIQSDVTTAVYMNRTIPGVANTAFTLPTLYHYSAAQGTIGSAASVTNQYGFVAEASLIGATGLNVGFAAVAIPSANVTSGKTVRAIQTNHDIATGGGTSYNLYINGTAPSYFEGSVGIGTTNLTDRSLSVSKSVTGGNTAYGIINNGVIQTDVTTAVYMNRTIPGVANTAFTLPNLYHYSASQGTIGSAASVTEQYGFFVEASLIGATEKNVGFHAVQIPSANVTSGKIVRAIQTNHDIATGGGTSHNLYINGTAPSYFEGSVGFGSTAPDAAARLQIDSTTQGFLPPRMNPTQRGNISSPPAGLMIYNSTTNKLNFYNGTAWEAVTSA